MKVWSERTKNHLSKWMTNQPTRYPSGSPAVWRHLTLPCPLLPHKGIRVWLSLDWLGPPVVLCVADWNAWQQPHCLCCSSWQDCPCHGGITVLHLLARDLAEASWPGAREAPSAGSSMVLVVAGHGSRPAVHLCMQQRALAACGKGIASREWSDVSRGAASGGVSVHISCVW